MVPPASSSPMPRQHMQRCRHPVSPVRHQHHLHRLYPSLNTSTFLLSVSLTFTTPSRTWLRGSFSRRFNTELSQVILTEKTRGREADCANYDERPPRLVRYPPFPIVYVISPRNRTNITGCGRNSQDVPEEDSTRL